MGNQEKDHNVIVQLFSPLPFEGGIPKEFMAIVFKISDLQRFKEYPKNLTYIYQNTIYF